MPACAELHLRPVLRVMQRRRQDGDVARNLAEPEILDDDLAELAQCGLLVFPVHRRPGVDNEAQRRMIVPVHGRVLGQHFQDRRHGEQVRDAVFLDQPVGFLDIEAIRRQQDRHGPRATWFNWCTPAPWLSGATTSDASSSVVPGRRSQRWLVMTNAI